MAERIVIRQTGSFETAILAVDPGAPPGEKPRPVSRLNELTPYGMILAGLGTCVGFVVNTYAQHHGVGVDAVELELDYRRSFKDDCLECEQAGTHYEDQILMVVGFEGDLAAQEREKLFKIAGHCPVHRMLAGGIKVVSRQKGAPTAG